MNTSTLMHFFITMIELCNCIIDDIRKSTFSRVWLGKLIVIYMLRYQKLEHWTWCISHIPLISARNFYLDKQKAWNQENGCSRRLPPSYSHGDAVCCGNVVISQHFNVVIGSGWIYLKIQFLSLWQQSSKAERSASRRSYFMPGAMSKRNPNRLH